MLGGGAGGSTANKLSPICAMFYGCQLSVAKEPQWS